MELGVPAVPGARRQLGTSPGEEQLTIVPLAAPRRHGRQAHGFGCSRLPHGSRWPQERGLQGPCSDAAGRNTSFKGNGECQGGGQGHSGSACPCSHGSPPQLSSK